jgi:predicted O-methyltransferase YrrM
MPSNLSAKLNAVTSRLQTLAYHYISPLPQISMEDVIGEPAQPIKPSIMDGIGVPPYVGDPNVDDFSALAQIALAKRPRLILEIGTARGNLAANLCALLPTARVITVNAPVEVQTGSVVTWQLGESEIGEVYRTHGFGSRVKQLLVNSRDLQLGQYLSDEQIDLAIVDGCHDIDFVLNDFGKVYPFLSSKGVVLLHDTVPEVFPRDLVTASGKPVFRKHLRLSYTACMQLRQRGFPVSHLRGTWWGICIKP